MHLLQLLWNESSVSRHGDNGGSLRCCYSLLLPNQGRWRHKLPLCSSAAHGLSEDVFVVSVKECLCLTLQRPTEFLEIFMTKTPSDVRQDETVAFLGCCMTHSPQDFFHLSFPPPLYSDPLFQTISTSLSSGLKHINFTFILIMTCVSLQVDFTSCTGFLCIAAVSFMIIGIVTAIILSFQYVRTPWSNFSNLLARVMFVRMRPLGGIYLCSRFYIQAFLMSLNRFLGCICCTLQLEPSFTRWSVDTCQAEGRFWVLQGCCWLTWGIMIPKDRIIHST